MNNNPKLRFKDKNGNAYPEWRIITLGDIFNISAGGDIKKNNCTKEKTDLNIYPVYANALTNDGLYGYTNSYKVKSPAITITGRGDVGHAVSRKEPFYPIVRLLVLQPNTELNTDFYTSAINRTKIFIESTGVPQLTSPQVAKVKLFAPCLEEQEKIAGFLSKVDELINECESEVKDLEEQKKGLMQKIFSQQIRFKDSNNNPYPDWKEKKIEDIATLTSSKRIHASDYVPKGIPFYRGKEITELKTNKKISELLYISEDIYDEYKMKYGAPQKNDILVTAVGTLGNVWAVDNEYPFYFKDGNLIWFKYVKENSKFIEYLLLSPKGKKKLLNSAIGSNQKALTIVGINKLHFKFPCLKEQEKIAKVLSKMDELIKEKKALLSDWQQFKKGLLQQMFI